MNFASLEDINRAVPNISNNLTSTRIRLHMLLTDAWPDEVRWSEK